MKRRFPVGIGLIALTVAFASYRSCCEHEHASQQIVNDTNDWHPSDSELANGDKGVGWVFGRMIGVADAPGSPKHSPFGGASEWQPDSHSVAR